MPSGNGTHDPSRAEGGKSIPAKPEVRGYELLERIGKGGMGEVYLARQLALGRLVAVKFLAPEGESDPEHDLARFRREAELMAKVSHPNILSIYDFGESDGRPYLVMEYVEGGDLRQRVVHGHPMSPDQLRSIVLPVGEALAYLHRQGIIHRDLKPENILLHDGKNPRVTDFGIAVLRAGGGAGELAHTGRGLGTLGYVAPEQQYRLKLDERADQYSLAALSYELLTGQLPLGVFKPPSHLNRRLGPEVDAVILRALKEDPKDRFATIREFAAALDRALPLHPRMSWHPSSWRVGWALAALLAIAGVIAMYLMLATTMGSRLLSYPRGTAKASPATSKAGAVRTSPPTLTEELKRLRARKIWEARGRPTGEAGKAAQESIWFEAAEGIEQELKEIAYAIWEERGRPTGPAGEAVQDEIWAEAEKRLYNQMSGKDPPAPEPR